MYLGSGIDLHYTIIECVLANAAVFQDPRLYINQFNLLTSKDNLMTNPIFWLFTSKVTRNIHDMLSIMFHELVTV